MREIEQVRKAIANNQIPPVYLWYGDERFLLQQALTLLKDSYLKNDPSGSGIETVQAKDIMPNEIVERANTVSFFSNKLLIVDKIPYFQEGQGNTLEPFYKYFSNPNPNTCLLFISQNVNRGRKFYKEIQKIGQILEFTAPKRNQEWLAWLDSELKHRGKTMRPEVKVFFLEWAGHQPGILSSELDKLALYVGDRELIGPEDIKEIVPQNAEATVFELLDAVAARSSEKAITKLHHVLKQEHPLKVLTLLVRQVRLLLGANAMKQQGYTLDDAPRILGIKPFEAKKIWQKSTALSWEQLTEALKECLETEVAIKTGKGEPEFLLELMVAKFCAL